MNFVHYGEDYSNAISKIPARELEILRVEDDNHLLPCNPVCSDPEKPVRMAFFGINAYCNDKDFPEAIKQQNFIEWCQENYRANLKNVINLWVNGLPAEYTNQGAVYYSNLTKLVLREAYFKEASDLNRAFEETPHTKALFKSLFVQEVLALKKGGCQVFVCFGSDTYDIASQSLELEGVTFIKERHFSRYIANTTNGLIQSTKIQALA